MKDRKYTSFVDADNGKSIHAWTDSDDKSSITVVHGLGKKESYTPTVREPIDFDLSGTGGTILFGILGVVVGTLAFVGIVAIFLFICRACYSG